MFNVLETKTTKYSYNKLLLLLLILLYISPISHELEQKQKSQTPVQSSSSTDNLTVKRDFELTFENFTCSTIHDNEDNLKHSTMDHMQIVEKVSCNLNKNAKRRYLQMEMSFKRQINHFNFNILIVLQRSRHAAEKEFILLNLTSINGCDLLALKHQVRLMNSAFASLKHYSNLPQKCPLLAHITYYIRGFKWDMEQMPPFFIEAPVTIEFSYILDNSTKIVGSIKAKLELKANKKFILS